MRTEAVIARYGTQKAVAEALGITRAAVGQWGAVVPYISAMRLEGVTGGELRLDPDAYDERGRPKGE